MPTVVWPTWAMFLPIEPQGEALLEQRFWSWGHLEVLPSEVGDLMVPEVSRALVPLATQAVILLAALAASGLALLRGGRRSQVIAAVGAVAGWMLVATGVARRSSEFQRWENFGAGDGLRMSTMPAGWAENAALAALTIALAMMLWRPVLQVSLPAWRQLLRRAAVAAAREDQPEREQATQTGGIVVHGARRDTDDSRRWATPDQGVPFTDVSPDDDWFRPT